MLDTPTRWVCTHSRAKGAKWTIVDNRASTLTAVPAKNALAFNLLTRNLLAMLLDGKAVAEKICAEIRLELENSSTRPCLVAVLVGDSPASHLYVRSKVVACERAGIASRQLLLPSQTTEAELLHLIAQLNEDATVTGILVQLPLPNHLNPFRIAGALSPDKDVDGVHPISIGKLLSGQPGGFISCTPLGIKVLLQRYDIPVAGRHVVIAGRSNIVGKPLAALLVQKGVDATVTVVHSKTSDIQSIVGQADILVAAIGQAHFFRAGMLRRGAVVVDVGQNRLADPSHPKGFRLVGDVAFDEVKGWCPAITPVPGGVGPMTIAMLLSNTMQAWRQQGGR